jgi:uncharacterized protein YciI
VKYYAAFLKMLDPQKSQDYRPQHLDFLVQNERAGRLFARGRFADGGGGLVIYIAESLDEARKIAESDPYIQFGARSLDLHEWEMKTAK